MKLKRADAQNTAKIKINGLSSLTRLLYCGLHSACQTLVNKRQNTSASNSSSNESIKLLITSNGKLQVARSYTLDTEIFRRVSYIPIKFSKYEQFKVQNYLPASSNTSAVRYSRIADVYTAALAPIRTLC